MKKPKHTISINWLIASVFGTVFIVLFYAYIALSSSSYDSDKTVELSQFLTGTSSLILFVSIISVFKTRGWKITISVICAAVSTIVLVLAAFAASFSQFGS